MEKLGKLHKSDFEQIIYQRCGFARKEVSTGAGFGIDVSVTDLPNNLVMALTSDPLSLIPSLGLKESAWLSVHLMANDMATTGFAPQYAQMVLNLPPSLSKADFETYWEYIHQFCSEIGVTITGGHTGSIEGQNSTISGGGTMITVAPKNDLLVSQNARPGDVILVTKTCALSSVAILALSFPETIRQKLGNATHETACELFYQTSSLPEGLAVTSLGANNRSVTAMHDVTEGGVLGAIYELAVASGNGVKIDNDRLPIGQVQQAICDLFAIDPRYCIGAGSMIITVEKDFAETVINALQKENIPCTAVGELTDAGDGMQLVTGKREETLPYYEHDPYWAAFFNAIKNGWK